MFFLHDSCVFTNKDIFLHHRQLVRLVMPATEVGCCDRYNTTPFAHTVKEDSAFRCFSSGDFGRAFLVRVNALDHYYVLGSRNFQSAKETVVSLPTMSFLPLFQAQCWLHCFRLQCWLHCFRRPSHRRDQGQGSSVGMLEKCFNFSRS
jgi:hypothetical protein